MPSTRSKMSERAQARAHPVESGSSAPARPLQNEILARIPSAELAILLEQAQEIHCRSRDEMFEAGSVIDRVYFPQTGMASLVIVLEDGTTVEALTVGREGFTGVPLLNSVATARYNGICQIEGSFLTLSAETFLSIIDRLPDLSRRLHRD